MQEVHLFMDELDMEILRTLQENSRLSYRKVAQILGISTSTVSQRISNLIEKGVIKSFTIELDSKKVGVPYSFVVHIKVSPGSNPIDVGRDISKLEEICYVYRIMGEFDLLVVGKSTSQEEAAEILNEITKIAGVAQANPSWILSIIKENHKLKLCPPIH
jgi:Lrp/AsnC family transcriptional regulator for asnA, asnC and gidA